MLNEDFRRLNADRINTPAAFVGVASDYNFEFRLACQDPNGNPSNGVVRRQTNKNSFSYIALPNSNGAPDENAMGIKMSNISGSDPWPTNSFLNMWVCDFSDGTLGYATFPADFVTNPNVDGVVIETTSMGRVGNVAAPFDRGRTATHEIGHWLNLRHINGDATCGDDFVGDTPQQRVQNFGCPGFPHPSNCPNNGANGDMFMNYMDYTDDGCMNIYTNGQRLRGRAIFAAGGPRAAFVNNYFSIQQPGAISCVGNVRLNNPNCFPVTWSIISGPATISNPTNAGVTLNVSATGIVALRATGGNYISDLNINVNQNGPSAPTGISGFSPTIGVSPGEILDLEAYETNQLSYNWDISGGTIVGNATGPHITVVVDNPCNGFITNGYFSAGVSYNNACGAGSWYGANCYIVCGTGGPMFAMSPNPTTDNVTIDGRNKNKSIKEVQVVDKVGNVKKVVKFGGEQKLINLNISTLPADIYYIKIFDGQKWESKQLRKQ